MNSYKLIGPFYQLLTLDSLPFKGALADDQLHIIRDAGVLMKDGHIIKVGLYKEFNLDALGGNVELEYLEDNYTGMPGLIDAHTHICFSGTRAMDYSMRLNGKTYLEIAPMGGGIHSTVAKTNEAVFSELYQATKNRALRALSDGITTIEIKSGYGLNVEEELKMLRVIHELDKALDQDIVPTCLAAHALPSGYKGSASDYLKMMRNELLPQVLEESLAKRIDIFIEKSAFTKDDSLPYLKEAKKMGFDIVVHADQFTTGGSEVAVSVNALSADHLEASTEKEIAMLAKSNTVAICLPGASMGLGEKYAPARKLLDAGAAVAIASDWNPGSAPMGDLLLQASVMAAFERITTTEIFSALTFRAAKALNLYDRGILKEGYLGDIIAFPTNDYRDILYYQGKMKPAKVWKKGKLQI
jgi:imidazolonepropionase